MKKNTDKIGLGTAAIGRPLYINIKQSATPKEFSLATFRQKGIDLLNDAYDQGIRYFDTAPGYGLAEQLLIDWIAKKDDKSIEIATKWGYTYVANFDSKAIQHEVKEHSLKKLNEQWKASKALLPFLTSYQIHSATVETGVLKNEPILNRLAALKEEYDLLIGISVTGKNQLEVLKTALDIEVNNTPLFDVFQATYNIFDQSLGVIAEEVAKQNKRLVIKEALANGRVFPNEKYPQHEMAYQTLKELSNKYKVGVDAIALRFCVDSIPVFKVLSGAANEQHLSDNLKTADFKLTAEDVERLKKLAVNPSAYWEERKQLGWN